MTFEGTGVRKMNKCKIAIIGISGFGGEHLAAAEKLEAENLIQLAAVCDTNYEINKEKLEDLAHRGVRYYSDYAELLRNEKELDFVAVSTPIHLHKKMAIDIMESCYNVLLEKPPAVTIQDVRSIIATSRKTGKLCGINFCITSGKSFIELRSLIKSGRLGHIKSITGVGLWKRNDSYYGRTPWAGKLMLNSHYVLDGTINNPLAHLANNMLFAAYSAGAKKVAGITSELYHAHQIQGDDTSCYKAQMDNGIVLNYYATLCAEKEVAPYIIVKGSEGRAVWNYKNELQIYISGNSSHAYEKKNYGAESYTENMYRNFLSVIMGDERELLCNVFDTEEFVAASNGAYESSGRIHDISGKYIRRYENNGSIDTEIKDINSIILKALEQEKLFSETGVEWAVPGKLFSLKDYDEFRMFI